MFVRVKQRRFQTNLLMWTCTKCCFSTSSINLLKWNLSPHKNTSDHGLQVNSVNVEPEWNSVMFSKPAASQYPVLIISPCDNKLGPGTTQLFSLNFCHISLHLVWILNLNNLSWKLGPDVRECVCVSVSLCVCGTHLSCPPSALLPDCTGNRKSG